MKLLNLLALLGLIKSPQLFAKKSAELDRLKGIFYQEQCEDITDYAVKGEYEVDCNKVFHHYNSNTSKNYYQTKNLKAGEIKIAGFNVLHPGQAKTRFKDYEIMAKLMNSWDLVGAVELLPLVGQDLKINNRIFNLLDKIETKRARVSSPSKLKELDQIEKEALGLFRIPGYLKILNELRKLDPSWALVLSPRGEAAQETNVQELAGFYYRGSKVRPKKNDYCYKYEGKGEAFGCIPSFSKKFMKGSYENIFSRRPFFASFQSGKFDFSILTSHVVFSSPKNQDLMKLILDPTFGVSHYKELGRGVNKQNYARFAEVATILKFMQKVRKKFSEKDLILVGDFNLEAKNPFWPEIMGLFQGGELYVEEGTSLRPYSVNSEGEIVSGYSSNYDHFLMDPEKTSECGDARVYDFLREEISDDIRKKYLMREIVDTPHDVEGANKRKMNKVVQKWKKRVAQQKILKGSKIVEQNQDIQQAIIDNLKKRVFLSQLEQKHALKVFKEVISDHAPIQMSCDTNRDDD